MTTATKGNNTGDTYSGTDDTWIGDQNPTTNNDGGNLEISKYASGNHQSGL